MTAPTTEKVATTTWTGQSLPRKEDERLLKAQGSWQSALDHFEAG